MKCSMRVDLFHHLHFVHCGNVTSCLTDAVQWMNFSHFVLSTSFRHLTCMNVHVYDVYVHVYDCLLNLFFYLSLLY